MRTKSFKRRLSNILLLGVLLVIAVGIYFNIYNSRAENVIEIGAVAKDSYGYLESEEFILEAIVLENEIYEIELPEAINGKKILETLEITLEDVQSKVLEETIDANEEETAESEETEGNTDVTEEASDAETSDATDETTSVEEKTTSEEKEGEEETLENETTEVVDETLNADENLKKENATTEEVEEEATPITLEIEKNKIQLTKEQIENKKINFKVTYDVAILEKAEEENFNKNLLSEKTEEELNEIEITEETELLYNKVLKYEDEENEKLVELRGFLPEKAELKIEEMLQENLTKIFGDKKIDVAYDIKILEPETIQEEVENEDGTIEIVEKIGYKEINPKDFGEICEVSIKDVNILKNSKVYHVREDNSYEQVEVKTSEKESITFEAETFSGYAVTADQGIMLAASTSDVVLSSLQVTSPESGSYGPNQEVTIEATFSGNVYGPSAAAITSSTAPTLKIKFGEGTERTTTFSSVIGSTIKYKYTIVNEDEGTLAVTGYNGTIYDINGNTTTINSLTTYCTGKTYTCEGGSQTDCTTCEGDGKVSTNTDCTICRKKGYVSCTNSKCNSGKVTCTTCNGSGNGSGTRECNGVFYESTMGYATYGSCYYCGDSFSGRILTCSHGCRSMVVFRFMGMFLW